MHMTVQTICDVLGRRSIAARVRVGLPAVSNASVAGQFPARWYLAIRAMCDEAGIACPDELFSFIPTSGGVGVERDAA
jgi:hypothetical protein